MRTSTLGAVLLLTLVVGCEHKSKSSDNSNPPPAATPKQEPGPPAAMAPPPSADEVRPPVAADLPEYLKDIPGKGKLIATFETSMGTIHCELYEAQTPVTVANFVGLATGKKPWKNPKLNSVAKNTPFYDGIVFHRVIPEFMIQGGDPLGVGTGGPGYQFQDEFVPELRMKPGVLAMANAGPGTNGSQFFITEVAPEHLNDHHTIFGQCKELDIVKSIARVPQDERNKPNPPVTINKLTISRMQSW